MAAALSIWAAGAVHLWLYWHDDYSSIPTIGRLFLLNGISAAIIGPWLLVSAAIPLLLAGIGYAAGTLIAFVISASHGLFGFQELWWGTPQAVALCTEAAALVLLLGLLTARAISRSRPRPGDRRLKPYERTL